ncbi:Hypothetical protein ACGLYG10_1965 [Actinomyces glycerinitolerans]|uniref:Uncharacterized protein n=1 Tax=Actinomyces glycerinitolerans TaxID=1892869 RepID=A0A1M4S0I2_9ACTO|nr:Hypothetical protein ACGLYG10_1965 [Actinomyces glycerinitolerans]
MEPGRGDREDDLAEYVALMSSEPQWSPVVETGKT